MVNTSHGAAPSALGYQHQTWWALLELLRTGVHRPDAMITLELHDDVAWQEEGTATELLQLKHHQNSQRRLTDNSPDLWSTLKVWMDTASPADPQGPTLVLVTTQTAAEESAVAALRAQPRDEQYAMDGLVAVAIDARSSATADARMQFLRLGPTDQHTFISRIRLMDGAPHIEDVESGVRQCLWWVLPTGYEDEFLAQVWHWWDGQALAMLQGRQTGVDVGTAHASITGIRDRFTQADLPTILEMHEIDQEMVNASLSDAKFVQQMQWVNYPPRNLESAVVDFYRASKQIIHWLAQGHIGPEELQRLQAELIREWTNAFEWMTMDLTPGVDEATKQAMGRKLLRDLTERPAITIRPRYTDVYLTCGQRHALADEGRVGWHVDYKELFSGRRTNEP